LLLLAHDMPILHRPVAGATLWLVDKVRVVKARVRVTLNRDQPGSSAAAA
jgi:hypothetical protein